MIDRKFIPKIALGDNQPLSNVSGCQFSEWRNSPCGCVSPWCPQYSSPYRSIQNQWIGLRENLQETMFLPLNMGFSCKISPKPIQWQNCSLDPKKRVIFPIKHGFSPDVLHEHLSLLAFWRIVRAQSGMKSQGAWRPYWCKLKQAGSVSF